MQDYALSIPTLRMLKPDEMTLLHEHLLRLGKLSRIMRFGRPVTDAFIDEYCYHLTAENSVVYGAFLKGVLRGAVEIRLMEDCATTEVELIFSVEDEWQNAGLGSVLMSGAVSAARGAHIDKVYLICLRENYPMRRVLAKTGSRFQMMTFVKPDQDDPESFGSDVFVTFLLDTGHQRARQPAVLVN